jgi:hypothetical protein
MQQAQEQLAHRTQRQQVLMMTRQALGAILTTTLAAVPMLQKCSAVTAIDAAAVTTVVGKQQRGRCQAAFLWWLPSLRHMQQHQTRRPLLLMQTAMTGMNMMKAGTLGVVMMDTAAGTSSSSCRTGGRLCWGLGPVR